MATRRRWSVRFVAGVVLLLAVSSVAVVERERVERVNVDTDRDGLADCAEDSGVTLAPDQAFGRTDPDLADTDGDGVTDGDEVSVRPPSTWIEQRLDLSWSCPVELGSVLSDPTKADTDGDLLGDAYELSAGSNAFVGDTDRDGLSDGRERGWGSDPNDGDTDGDGIRDGEDVEYGLSPVVVDERIDPDTWAEEFRDGLVNGDVEEEIDTVPQLLGSMAGGAASSVPVVGWFAGGIADARDTAANGIRGDWVAAGASAAGLLPYVGDAARATGLLAAFLVRYPEKVNTVAKAVAGLEKVPVTLRVRLLGVTDRAGLEQVQNYGLSDEQIIALARRGNSLAAIARGMSKAAGKRAIEASFADSTGFVPDFAAAQEALRARARSVDGEQVVAESPVYVPQVPGSDQEGGRLIDVCSRCSPSPQPGLSTLRIVKVGTQLHSTTVQREIDKDASLASNGYNVEWHFFAGRTGLAPDEQLLDALDDAGVRFYLHLPG